MSQNQYINYLAEDFAADVFFQNWILEKETMAVSFWENWIQDHPDRIAHIEQAKALLDEAVNIPFKNFTPEENDLNEVWSKIIHQTKAEHKTPIQSSYAYNWKLIAVAASFAILIVSSIFLIGQFNNGAAQIQHATGYNETKITVLPDGSEVMLNANSTISYPSDWSQSRQVYLDGTAYFSVIHTADDKEFVVHAGDLNVEVLGTKFEIKNRRGKTRVVLQEGKVKLDVTGNSDNSEVTMKPGELIEYSNKHQGLMKMHVNTTTYTAWTRNELFFENASLSEVAETIEDNYGYQVIFEDPELMNKIFTSKLEDKSDIDLLINILQETFNLNIYKNDNELILELK
jgi:ferric-dicitrate binding protein FerR (iron transport regulator)